MTSGIPLAKSSAAPLQDRNQNLPHLSAPTKFGKQHTPAATNKPPPVIKSSHPGQQEKSSELDHDHDVNNHTVPLCLEQKYQARCSITTNIYSRLFSNPATYQPYQMVSWKNRGYTKHYQHITDPSLPTVRSTQWPILYWDRRAAIVVCCYSDAPPLESQLHSAEVDNFSETAKEVWAAGNVGERIAAVKGDSGDNATQPRNLVYTGDKFVERQAPSSAPLLEPLPLISICMVSVFPSTIRIILLQWGQEAHSEYSKSQLHLSICDPIIETLPVNLPPPYTEVDWVQCHIRLVCESALRSKEKGCG